jgi:hypothetical protein
MDRSLRSDFGCVVKNGAGATHRKPSAALSCRVLSFISEEHTQDWASSGLAQKLQGRLATKNGRTFSDSGMDGRWHQVIGILRLANKASHSHPAWNRVVDRWLLTRGDDERRQEMKITSGLLKEELA